MSSRPRPGERGREREREKEQRKERSAVLKAGLETLLRMREQERDPDPEQEQAERRERLPSQPPPPKPLVTSSQEPLPPPQPVLPSASHDKHKVMGQCTALNQNRWGLHEKHIRTTGASGCPNRGLTMHPLGSVLGDIRSKSLNRPMAFNSINGKYWSLGTGHMWAFFHIETNVHVSSIHSWQCIANEKITCVHILLHAERIMQNYS